MNAQSQAAPTYAQLVAELDTLRAGVEKFSDGFLQLGALFESAQRAGDRTSHVLGAGRYLADDLANAADCMREAAGDVVDLAEPAIPRKRWQDCPCPDCSPGADTAMRYICANTHYDGPVRSVRDAE